MIFLYREIIVNSYYKISLCIIIFSFLTVFAEPLWAYKSAKPESEMKACFSNQRELSGAIEMYNMDNSEMIDNIYPGLDYENCEKMLIEKGYLKEMLFFPNQECSYGGINITSKGSIFCKLHGSAFNYNYNEGKKFVPEYDESLEKPFSTEYLEKQRKFMADKEHSRNMRHLILDLISNPLLVFVFIVISSYIGVQFFKYIERKLNE